MDDDFSIEVFAPQGYEVLRPHLSRGAGVGASNLGKGA
jgi:hypothetical protein